jgi:hypothetical protein
MYDRGAAQRPEPYDLTLPATLPTGPVAEVVCELGLATLVAEPPALDAPCVPVTALVAGLPLELLVAGLPPVLLLAVLPLRPEVEPVL